VTADVVVIGGGIIGASAAYHMAKRGLRVALIEGREIASGSSGACDGFVWLRSKPPGPLLDLARQSVRRYERLADELDADVRYRRCGGLILVETQAQRRALNPCHSEPFDCHSERLVRRSFSEGGSEGSGLSKREILRCAQNDTLRFEIVSKIICVILFTSRLVL